MNIFPDFLLSNPSRQSFLVMTFRPSSPGLTVCQKFLGSVEEELIYADKNVQKLRPDKRLSLGLGKPSTIGYSGCITTNQEGE